MPARCPDENTLVGFVDGRLDAPARAAIEAHLDECSTCASTMATFGRARSLAPLDSITEAVPLDARTRWGDRYEISACLGRGAMGTVYAARDTLLEREIALKVLHPRRANPNVDVREPERLLREARALAQIRHPNVVAVHDAGADGETFFLTMERVRGQSLAAWLRSAPRSTRDILDAFRQAGTGLAAAHEVGVLHRDFKPDNVMVGDDGVVRVTDFGLARPVLEASSMELEAGDAKTWSDPRLTAAGALVGTPAYMAPEQRNGEVVGYAADQFSFCVALREALLVGGARTDTPPWVMPILARGLERDPSRRYPSMRALVADLEAELRPPRSVSTRLNVVLQLTAFAFHALLVAIFVHYVATHDVGPQASATEPTTPTPIRLAIVLVYVVVWLPAGLVWTPINAWGLHRNRRWAAISTMIYAVTALPTCLGTPLGLVALGTLWRTARREKRSH